MEIVTRKYDTTSTVVIEVAREFLAGLPPREGLRMFPQGDIAEQEKARKIQYARVMAAPAVMADALQRAWGLMQERGIEWCPGWPVDIDGVPMTVEAAVVMARTMKPADAMDWLERMGRDQN